MQAMWIRMIFAVIVERQFPGNGKSDLRKVNSNGNQDSVTDYTILGDAETCATKLIKGNLWCIYHLFGKHMRSID